MILGISKVKKKKKNIMKNSKGENIQIIRIDPSTIETNTHLDVTAIGHALYIPDLPARKDRIEPLHDIDVNFEPPQPNIMSNASSVTLRFDLIQCYFDYIHPSMPFIFKSTFTESQPSTLLLNAMYAVSSRFVSPTQPSSSSATTTTTTTTTISSPLHPQHQQQPKSIDPPGWTYYKMALSLIDVYIDVPRLSTIQAILLLVKYHEHIHRPGFFWRTKFLLQLAVNMSNDLGLSSKFPQETTSCNYELEYRKRTFWAVYTYEVLMRLGCKNCQSKVILYLNVVCVCFYL